MLTDWLKDFTDAVMGIKDSYEYVKITTSVLDELSKFELEQAQIENKMLTYKSNLLLTDPKLSSEKLELQSMQDPVYQDWKDTYSEISVKIVTMKRALDVLRQFKDIMITEIRS